MWPAFIVRSFERIDLKTDEYSYYGSWNSVFNLSFDIREGYEIIPPGSRHRGEEDMFTVTKNRATIFFVSVKTPKVIYNISKRAETDEQMRNRLTELYEITPSDLHGVSAFGSRVCFYCLDEEKNKIDPVYSPEPSKEYTVDVAPAGRWDLDILTDEGFAKFMEVVQATKESSAHNRKYRLFHSIIC